MTAKGTLLIIDDDHKLNELLLPFFKSHGWEATAVEHPLKGLAKLREESFSCIILDVMLPDLDGFETCRRIRKESSIPIIMLTARGDLTDKIVGLEIGADDYLPKPFEPRELIARIEAIQRRSSRQMKEFTEESIKNELNRIAFDGLDIDLTSQTAWHNEVELELSTIEFEVLKTLAQAVGRTFSRNQLLDKLHEGPWSVSDRAVDVAVSRLRTKLAEDAKHPKYIKTIWGTGYRWIAKRVDL
ncbi:MAG: response regulator transcription factor [Pseudobacteriovorax sp.]|nr:response regulator transcription factor [Pseudobacteriovorax sp.]